MNNRSLLGALAIAALVIAGAAAVGIGAYNAGVAHGIAQNVQAIAAPPAGTPYMYVWPRPWGFGFFPIFPFFFVLFFFVVLRGLFWGGRWRGGRRCWYDRVPPEFDEWHRRAHGERPLSTPPSGGTTTP